MVAYLQALDLQLRVFLGVSGQYLVAGCLFLACCYPRSCCVVCCVPPGCIPTVASGSSAWQVCAVRTLSRVHSR